MRKNIVATDLVCSADSVHFYRYFILLNVPSISCFVFFSSLGCEGHCGYTYNCVFRLYHWEIKAHIILFYIIYKLDV